MIADEVNMNQETFHLILTEELGMRKISANTVTRNLTQQQQDMQFSAIFTSKCITVRLQPPYSPDLIPFDFFLFQKVKTALKGHHFESTEDIQRYVTQVLNNIPQNAFQDCYKQLQHRWKRCVQAEGMYFEGDHTVADEQIR
jgi:hypothetical protein